MISHPATVPLSIRKFTIARGVDTFGHSLRPQGHCRLPTVKHASPTKKASPLSTTDPRISKNSEIKKKMIAAMTFIASRLPDGGSSSAFGSSTSDADWCGLIISRHPLPAWQSNPRHGEPSCRNARAYRRDAFS